MSRELELLQESLTSAKLEPIVSKFSKEIIFILNDTAREKQISSSVFSPVLSKELTKKLLDGYMKEIKEGNPLDIDDDNDPWILVINPALLWLFKQIPKYKGFGPRTFKALLKKELDGNHNTFTRLRDEINKLN